MSNAPEPIWVASIYSHPNIKKQTFNTMTLFATAQDLADKVRDLQNRRELSQKEMAQAVNVAQSNLSRALGGQPDRYASVLAHVLEHYTEWNAHHRVWYRLEK
jgi:predicted transcriptional regulator